MVIHSRSRPRRGAALAVLLLIGLFPASAISEPEMAVIEVLGERPFLARLAAAGPTQLEVLPAGSTQPRVVPLERVIEVRLPVTAAEPSAPAAHRVTLMGGSVLFGTLSSPDEESFQMAVRGAGTVRLPYEALASFEVLPPKAGPCTDLTDVYRPDPKEDVVHLRRGDDRITGTLMDADANEIEFETARGRTRRIAWRDVRVMHLKNEPVEAEPGVRGEVELFDGTRFVTRKPPVLGGTTLRLQLLSAPEAAFTVPLRQVRAIRYTGGAFVHLSTLPFEATYTAFYPGDSEVFVDISKRFNDARVDRGLDGCPLQLGGRTYRYGFGVHAKSEIRVPIDGAYTRFQAVVGLDESVRQLGSSQAANVDVRVVGDGKVLWEKEGITLASGAEKVGPIDVSGVNALTLVVDFGKNGREGDRVTWGHPLLVRK